MKKALSSTLIAATVLTGGVFGASVAGAVDDAPTLSDAAVETTDVQTQDQAPETESETDGEGCDRDGRRGHRRGGADLGIVAEILDVEVDELKTELRAGATVADIAGDRTDAVIDALVDAKQERLDQAVADGRLTQEEADEKLADLEDRITERVNNGRPDRGAASDTEAA